MIVDIPLTNAYNTRRAGTNAPPGTAGIVGQAVVGRAIVDRSATSPSEKDARYINCFLTKEDGTEYIVNWPGFAALNTPQSGSVGSAILVWTGSSNKVITAFGGTNSSIYDGTSRLTTNHTDTTVISGKAAGITETDLSGTATIAITSGDNTAWYYQPSGTVTKITDGQFPGNNSRTLAGTMCHMDGYAFQLDTRGDLWNSDLNSITSWTATGKISCNSYPDAGVAAIRWSSNIIGFGSETMQFFENAGRSFGSPLKRTRTLKIGCIRADAITQIGDYVFFVGSSDKGGLTVYQFNGEVERISTPVIDFMLTLIGASNISLTSLKVYGLSFVIVNANSLSYVYSLEDNRWHERSATNRLWYKCAGISTVSYAISDVSTSGKVYTINPASIVFTDDGQTMNSTIQTRNIDLGNANRKFWERLDVICDEQSSTSSLAAYVSDDDYVTWSLLGTLDLSDSHPRLNRLGSSKRRAFKFIHSSAVPLRIQAAKLWATVGQ